MKLANAIQGFLDQAGLQRKTSALRPLGWLLTGLVLGGTAALVLAPYSGKKARRRMGKLMHEGISEAEKDLRFAEKYAHKATQAVKAFAVS
jgi:gas vesicle protein